MYCSWGDWEKGAVVSHSSSPTSQLIMLPFCAQMIWLLDINSFLIDGMCQACNHKVTFDSVNASQFTLWFFSWPFDWFETTKNRGLLIVPSYGRYLFPFMYYQLSLQKLFLKTRPRNPHTAFVACFMTSFNTQKLYPNKTSNRSLC